MTIISAKRSAATNDAATGRALERVRLETRDVHRELESLPVWELSFRELSSYAALLDGLLSLVRPADREIGRALGDSAPDWFSATARTERLEADRRDVAARLQAPGPQSPEDDPALGALGESSRAAAAGLLYVLEGSALGGRVLSRRLRDAFGFDAEAGGRYFHGHGAESGARWNRFLAWFAEVAPNEPDADAAASAAKLGFERFYVRLAGLSHA